MNKEIVYLRKDDAFTDSLVIAEATNNQHESLIRLIRQHQERLEKFGKIEFSDLKSEKRGRPKKYCLLNEPQATLLISFLDNSDIVADFKVELVKKFFEMRKFIAERHTKEWIETRRQGKLARKDETDEIKKFIEYAIAQGSNHSSWYYKAFSELADKMCGIKPKHRDDATTMQLNNLAIFENIILQIIKHDLKEGIPYKQIYQNCKERCNMARDIAMISNY